MESLEIELMLIAVGLLAFGLVYAYKVAMHPFPISLSWLSALIACVTTNSGVSLALWPITHSWLAIAVLWVAYVLTGVPVILALVFKFRLLSTQAKERADRADGFRGAGAERRA